MSDIVRETPAAADDDNPVLRRLSTLDRFLPVWIGVAMVAGCCLVAGSPAPPPDGRGRLHLAAHRHRPARDDAPGAGQGALQRARPRHARSRLLGTSMVLNWVVGPALMFTLAWLLLPDLPEYRTGLIIVGLARCIAMVLIWNDLACGDREAAAILVAINAVFQILAFALLGYFYLQVLPGWLGLDQTDLHVSMWAIARSVLVFLWIPSSPDI